MVTFRASLFLVEFEISLAFALDGGGLCECALACSRVNWPESSQQLGGMCDLDSAQASLLDSDDRQCHFDACD